MSICLVLALALHHKVIYHLQTNISRQITPIHAGEELKELFVAFYKPFLDLFVPEQSVR